MSLAVADENGYYEMIYRQYPRQIMGVKAGPCKVYVGTGLGDDHPAGPRPETIPKCYSGKETVIEREVEASANTIDLALTSDCTVPE